MDVTASTAVPPDTFSLRDEEILSRSRSFYDTTQLCPGIVDRAQTYVTGRADLQAATTELLPDTSTSLRCDLRPGTQGKRPSEPKKAHATVVLPGGSVREAPRVGGVWRSTAAKRIRGLSEAFDDWPVFSLKIPKHVRQQPAQKPAQMRPPVSRAA